MKKRFSLVTMILLVIAGCGGGCGSQPATMPHVEGDGGLLDVSFGDSGTITFEYKSEYEYKMQDMIIDSADRFLITGYIRFYEEDMCENSEVGCYTNCELDQNGEKNLCISHICTKDAEGTISCVDSAQYQWKDDDYRMAVWRYNSDGTPDKTFGNEGVVVASELKSRGNEIAINSRGNIIVAGTRNLVYYEKGISLQDSRDELVIWRYLPDGTLDEKFGVQGFFHSDLKYEDYPENSPYDCADAHGNCSPSGLSTRDSDDNIYVISGPYLWKVNNAGFLNDVVKNNRTWTYQNAPNDNKFCNLKIGNYDKIITGDDQGYVSQYVDDALGLNKEPVISFNVGLRSACEIASDQKTGNIIAAGEPNDSPYPSSFAVARFTPDGKPDTTFNGTGMFIYNYYDILDGGSFMDVVVFEDKIIALADYSDEAVLMRFNGDGSLDGSFGTGGVISVKGIVATSLKLDLSNNILVISDYHRVGDDDGRMSVRRYKNP